MKRIILLLNCLVILSVGAQERSYYKDVVLKTNVFSPISLGVEFPIKDNFTIEYMARRAGTFVFSKNTYRDERLLVKYHMPFSFMFDKRKSFYAMMGLHHVYRELDNRIYRSNEKEYGRLDQNRLTLGVGVRYKYLDLWVATESVFFERTNYYERRDSDGKILNADYWKSESGLSIGLSINFLNISKLRWNSH
ncbi:MAG: hypothetical protein IT245_01645 [Bacteroidia bacterium]|nr:hypothetical protein [Bacteroidia bacterium]